MQKNLVIRRQEQWYIIPCSGREQEILLSIIEQEREGFDPHSQDVYACLCELGWEIEFASTFAA